MEVRFIGSGDAFGSGGRLQPCILATDKESRFALDFGLTALINFTADADLLIAEYYYFDKPVKQHLNYPDIQHLKAKKIVLTHMHETMLTHKDEVPETCAYDGMEMII